MIDKEEEYQRMYAVEQTLWWYRILHGKVLRQVRKAGQPGTLNILDAACGTGGLMSFLKENGYTALTGFDYAGHALTRAAERGLQVHFGDLRKVEAFRPEERYDVICCNDALYFLSDDEIVRALQAFRKRLTANGRILINIHAFEAFSGTHDIAVGSVRRFTARDFRKYTEAAGLQIACQTYWPFCLSLPIYIVRSWQRFRIRNGAYHNRKPASDVQDPGGFINRVLYALVRVEEKLLPRAPFGSSLFMVVQ